MAERFAAPAHALHFLIYTKQKNRLSEKLHDLQNDRLRNIGWTRRNGPRCRLCHRKHKSEDTTMTHGIHHVTAMATGASECGLLYPHTGAADGQEDRQLRRPQHLPLLLRGRDRPTRDDRTFFPWEHVAAGRLGVGETQETLFRVPEVSIGYWTHRFIEKGVAHEPVDKRFGETVLSFKDLDGMRLALVAVPGAENKPAWSSGRRRTSCHPRLP